PAGQVAKQLGLSQATVSRSLKLLTLPEEVQQQIAAGVIPDSVGYELSQLMDAGEQVLMAEQIASGTMTRDQLQAKRKTKQTDNASGLPSPSRAVARLGAGRSVSVTGNNLTLDAFIAQLEEVLRQARKVRPKGVELKTFLQLLADGAKGTQA
ncbi:MAG: hypothetical protein KDA65_18535, partial [Planctomycetaceae bacterium]|nr:hypothetical protein [Planctomycetaceae bacterium]